MPPEESVEVVPSEDNGNVPADAPESTPSAEPTPADAPAADTVPAADPAATVELFELPDGRKVDAATLTKEWKENFLPEYTRTTQALAAKKEPLQTDPSKDNKYADPAYVPQTYDEIIEAATQRALQTLEGKEASRIAAQKALEDAVESQLTEIKKTDPNVNENALFLHATKYGFRDLKSAHQNMKDMSDVVKKTQTQTAQNIAKRNDPVSASPGATGAKPDPSQFGSAIEYLRSIRK